MTPAEQEYRRLLDWSSAVRLGINGTITLLQALTLKGVFTPDEALMLIDEMASTAAQQSSTSDAQKTIVAASYETARELLRR